MCDEPSCSSLIYPVCKTYFGLFMVRMKRFLPVKALLWAHLLEIPPVVEAFVPTPSSRGQRIDVGSLSLGRWGCHGLLLQQLPRGYPLRKETRRCTVPDKTGGASITTGTEGEEVIAEEWDGFRVEDHERFLTDFWQKKPLLIRNAIPG